MLPYILVSYLVWYNSDQSIWLTRRNQPKLIDNTSRSYIEEGE